MKVLILGAGYGTRLQRDLSSSEEYKHLLGVPKALLPLGNRDALITHWIELFEKHGISAQDSIYIVTNGQCYDAFKTWALAHHVPLDHIVSDGTETNETRLGAVPDILFGIHHFGLQNDHVLVVGGDTLFLHDFDLRQFLHAFEAREASCLVTTYQVTDEDVHKFGIVETDAQGDIISFLEKPAPTVTSVRSACPCFYLFHKQAIPLIEAFIEECKATNAPKEAYDATGKCLAYLYPRFRVSTFPISGRIDVGGLQSYIDANAYFQ
ncbi:mannose-1-phosphate guanyltransferase beta-like protein [Gilbertella persicaria]|uniref:mannose-1-phosphate guanyltransferase beta-like protein n=1 Tax=Gilbertella persicaria TaxID=101096 RepID=UPI00221F130D|nr:mannose-1-phosphate guanyltransferase beta-like protein [Gilbertella persicaria]KAI8079111.1 mannose-1-phosphate guanyltransferase beta-like protein [Gilbertella persicaria]